MGRKLPVAALLALMAMPLSLAGSLTPPGPPAPTMKALDVVEPRTPIRSLPFTIGTSGSYYLTGNLTGGTGNGITVNAGPTTIDLNGFTLAGVGLGSGYAILGTTTASLHVRNGTISNWGGGILALTTPVTIDRVTAQGCLTDGADVGDAIVKDSLFLFNGQNGLYIKGVGIVTNTRAGGNGMLGAFLDGPRGRVDNCIIDGNGYAFPSGGLRIGTAGSIRHSSICNNTGYGISAEARALILENNVFVNSGDGISVFEGESRIEGNHVTGNGGYGVNTTLAYNTVIMNSARSNALGNYSIAGTPNVATFDGTGISTNPWVNFSF